MRSTIPFTGLWAGARFFAQLPLYLRRQIIPQIAREMQALRLQQRAQRLLERFRLDVYGRRGSVFDELVRHAGCEYGDIEAGVQRDGVESTLARLFAAGVYLTVDEFKGRKPVVRGTLRIEAGPNCLRSPRAAYHMPSSSGGSRTSGTPVLIDLRYVRACATNCALLFDAWGGNDWRKGDWESPGAGARFRLVKFAAFGRTPEAWFTQIHPDDSSLLPIVRWNTRAMRWAGAAAGKYLPGPIYAPLSDPTGVARWLASVLQDGGVPHLFTFAGSAVRLCRAAWSKGIDIAGSHLMLSGEPITEARVATVRQCGCVPIPRYGSMETGAIGYGCQHSEHADEVHLLSDMHAMIQAGENNGAGLPSKGLLITNLHARSPFLMINVSMGDQAEIGERQCGCALYGLGWTTQLHMIRSFEKLTGGGVTFLGTDVIRILDEVLPVRFGGTPTDYQLVEGEDAEGHPVIQLLVHPSLGALDERLIVETFYSELAALPGPAARMMRCWRDSNTLRVWRRPPIVSRAGKILHLYTGTTPAQS